MKKSAQILILILVVSIFLNQNLFAQQDTGENNQNNPPGSNYQEPNRSAPIFEDLLNATSNAEENFRDKKDKFEGFYIFIFLDSALQKGNIVSKIILGVNYEFELRYALALVFWLLFILFIPGIIRNISGWTTFTSTCSAIVSNIVLAQVMVFRGLSAITIGLITQRSIASLILFVFMFLILVAFLITLYLMSGLIQKRREAKRSLLAKIEKKVIVGGKPPEGDYQTNS